MPFLARAVVLGVMASLFATPLMACAMEAAQMSVSEAECCKAMAGDCHNQVGPASHKCCRTIASVPDSSKPVRTASVAPQVHAAAVAVTIAVPAPAVIAVPLAAADTSPPGSPSVCSSVLRI